MAKKQTRRSISVSRTTYERLKNFCEANNISMSQFVETRVGDFLGGDSETVHLERTAPSTPSMSVSSERPSAPRPVHTMMPSTPSLPRSTTPAMVPPKAPQEAPRPAPAVVPMTSAAARFAVEPPPPIIKPKQETAAPKPAEKRPDQIFTF